jgi:hypothetical protein
LQVFVQGEHQSEARATRRDRTGDLLITNFPFEAQVIDSSCGAHDSDISFSACIADADPPIAPPVEADLIGRPEDEGTDAGVE